MHLKLESGITITISVSCWGFVNLYKAKQAISVINETFVLETDTAEISIEMLYEKAAMVRGISIMELENIVDYNLKTIFRW